MSEVCLRPISDSDTPNIVKWRNTDVVRNNLIDRNPITEEGHRAYLQRFIYTKERYQFIIYLLQDGEESDIGSCFVKSIDYDNKKAEIGIFIGEESARGKGYAKYAIAKLLDFCFTELHMEKIFLWVMDTNTVAKILYKKIGFVEIMTNEDGFILMEFSQRKE